MTYSLNTLNASAAAKSPPLVWLTASSGKDTRLIMVDDIAYFQSDTKYTAVMTAEGEALLRKPIRELLDVLDPAIFKQIHRSTIVNMKAVAAVSRDDTGRGVLRLADGQADGGQAGRRGDAVKELAQLFEGVGLEFVEVRVHVGWSSCIRPGGGMKEVPAGRAGRGP